MIVLGLHLGHDATACILADGNILSFIEKERITRVKHASLMSIDLIDAALQNAKIDITEVNFVGITQTQNWPTVFLDKREFFFEIDPSRASELNFPESLGEKVLSDYQKLQNDNKDFINERFSSVFLKRGNAIGDTVADTLDTKNPNFDVTYSREFVAWPTHFQHSLGSGRPTNYPTQLLEQINPNNKRRIKYHIPINVKIHGYEIPGAQFPHHLAHAAVAHYTSNKENTAIMTVDNGYGTGPFGHIGGLYCIGKDTQLTVLGPNGTYHGHVYNRMGQALGWKPNEAAGKLMGLAPYGSPNFYDPSMLGTYQKALQLSDDEVGSASDTTRAWKEYIKTSMRELGYAHSTDDVDKLPPHLVDIAASVQVFFEEQTNYFASNFHALCGRINFQPEVLGLSGGCALNCPANSLLHRIGRFPEIFVPPSVDDSGLALGAAYLAVHDLFDIPRTLQNPYSSTSAYLGREWSESEVKSAIKTSLADIKVDQLINPAEAAASDLIKNDIVAWFEGRSEAGPRALGNRSILANATQKDNWRRTNIIKKREKWRPFAPAVLEEKNQNWFEGAPPRSPFMLFTAQVKGDDLPAVTHVDGSARVQTVATDCGGIRKLLESLDKRTGVPVVLNTSLNGPGEPIVDTPQEAINFLKTSEIDTLYLQGFRIRRRTS